MGPSPWRSDHILLELLIFRLDPPCGRRDVRHHHICPDRHLCGRKQTDAARQRLGRALSVPATCPIDDPQHPLRASPGLAIGVVVGFRWLHSGGSTEIIAYLLVGTLMGALSLGQAERLKTFLRAGLSVALVNAAIILLFGLLRPEQDMLKRASTPWWVVSGGMATSLALAAFFVLSACWT